MELNAFLIKGVRGGIADDPSRSVRETFRFAYGLDIRGEGNTIKCNQALKKDTGDITDLVLSFVPASNGQLYGFGDSGEIYRKATPTSAWENVYTDLNGKITGAGEYTNNDGAENYVPYLYWATEGKVSRILLSKADENNWITDVEHDWQSLKNGDPEWQTIVEALGVLLICDAQNLAMVDYEGGFNPEALDVPKGHRHKCLLGLDQLAVIGSTKGDQVNEGWLWTWDKIQPSWIQRRMVAERGINAIIQGEYLLVQAGVKGNLYYWDTSNLRHLCKIPGKDGWVNPGAIANYNGIPIFGVNGSDKCGVYSFGKLNINRPRALNLDFIPSHGKLKDVLIGAVAMYGDQPFVSTKDGDTYGIDTIDPDNKAEGRYESLIFDGGKSFEQKGFRHIKLLTKPLPKDTSIEIFYRLNENGDWEKATMQDGAEQFDKEGKTKAIFTIETGGDEIEPGQGEEYEVAANLHPAGNLTPEIKTISSYFEPLGVM